MGTDINQQSVEEFLTNTEFTIPVNLPATGKGSRTIKVTYDFNDEIADKFNEGRMIEEQIPDPENPGQMKTASVKKNLTLNQQLAMTVKKIDEVDTPPDEVFWSKTFLKYRAAIIKAIMEDVYPNAKISGV